MFAQSTAFASEFGEGDSENNVIIAAAVNALLVLAVTITAAR